MQKVASHHQYANPVLLDNYVQTFVNHYHHRSVKRIHCYLNVDQFLPQAGIAIPHILVGVYVVLHQIWIVAIFPFVISRL
jgi:hypothetical protein